MTERVDYRVTGLDCAEEVAILRKVVGERAGVVDMEFDVLNARMNVRYDADRITPADIVDAVETTGMRAVRWEERGRGEGGWWRGHGRAAMATLSGALLFAGYLVHALAHGFLHALAHGGATEPRFPAASLILFVAAIVTGAWYVAPKALYAVRTLRPDMNLLMVLAVAGAAAIGEWFEAATVAFLFAMALLLEQWSVARARRAIGALLDITPATARFLDESGAVREASAADVPVGATALVRPHEKVPLDGTVTAGASQVNQAPITGESAPVDKAPGDEVYAGTINGDGALEFRVDRAAADTTLARIIHMVEEAQSRRAGAQQWVERFARWYTPAMMGLAAVVALLPPLTTGAAWGDWFYRGLVILVIACPCALVISTPVSIVSSLTAAARRGVLIKGGMYLEAAAGLRALAFDKTGTLTFGRPAVQQIVPVEGHTRAEVLRRAAALEANSDHPVARAILRRAEAENVPIDRAEQFQTIKGKGAEGRLDGRLFWIGSHRMMHDRTDDEPRLHEQIEALEDAGHSAVILGRGDHLCGLISIADGLRETAAPTVAALHRAGVEHVIMLTGDNQGTARAIAEAAGIEDFRSELLPEDKLRAVEALVERYGSVAMVGDGVNDAPAMAASTLGVAMGAMGTDVAIETADVALMADDLTRLPWLIGHARRTVRTIKHNTAFALGVKGAFVALTLIGVASLWAAIAADMGASLLVIFNGLRLLRTKEDAGSRIAKVE